MLVHFMTDVVGTGMTLAFLDPCTNKNNYGHCCPKRCTRLSEEGVARGSARLNAASEPSWKRSVYYNLDISVGVGRS